MPLTSNIIACFLLRVCMEEEDFCILDWYSFLTLLHPSSFFGCFKRAWCGKKQVHSFLNTVSWNKGGNEERAGSNTGMPHIFCFEFAFFCIIRGIPLKRTIHISQAGFRDRIWWRHDPSQFRASQLAHLPIPVVVWGGWPMSVCWLTLSRSDAEVTYDTFVTSFGQYGTCAGLARG